jgi:hypothetical protein
VEISETSGGQSDLLGSSLVTCLKALSILRPRRDPIDPKNTYGDPIWCEWARSRLDIRHNREQGKRPACPRVGMSAT